MSANGDQDVENILGQNGLVVGGGICSEESLERRISTLIEPVPNYHPRHSKQKLLQCKLCGKRYHLTGKMRSHARKHVAVKIFSCFVCSETFVWKQSRDRHYRNRHGGKPKQKAAN